MNKFSELVTEMEHLYELRDVPVVGWQSFDELIDWVENKLGYKFLGSGSYSFVYGKGNYVVKIQRPGIPTSRPMRCNIRFHRISLNSDNPHFPKVYFVKVYKDEEGTHKYVFGTEKLYPVDYRITESQLPKNVEMAAMYVAFLTQYLGVIELDVAISFLNETLGSIKNDEEHTGEFTLQMQRMRQLAFDFRTTEHPLALAYMQIMELLQDSRCFNDITRRNTMVRKDGTIVFSDPIADKTREW